MPERVWILVIIALIAIFALLVHARAEETPVSPQFKVLSHECKKLDIGNNVIAEVCCDVVEILPGHPPGRMCIYRPWKGQDT